MPSPVATPTPEDNVPRSRQVVHLAARLAVYLAALAVLATARLPAEPSSLRAIQPSSPVGAEPAGRPPSDPPSAVRLGLVLLLLTGAALDLSGRRA